MIIGKLIGTGVRAEVYELEDQWPIPRCLKLYHKWAKSKEAAFREATKHASVEMLGLAVPSIHGVQEMQSRWGIIYDRVSGDSFSDQRREPDRVRKEDALVVAVVGCLSDPVQKVDAEIVFRLSEIHFTGEGVHVPDEGFHHRPEPGVVRAGHRLEHGWGHVLHLPDNACGHLVSLCNRVQSTAIECSAIALDCIMSSREVC